MKIAQLFLATWLAVSISGCGGDAADGAAAGGGGRPRSALVRVAPVVREAVRPITTAVGTVIARRTSIVASGADGKVDQFLVRMGDIVEEGAPLSILNMVTTNLEIDEAEAMLQEREQLFLEMQGSRKEEIDEALARMEAAAVTRDVAAERLERWTRLSQTGAAALDTLDDARERAQAAAKLYQAAKANYELVLSGPRAEARLQAQARLDAQRHQVNFLKAERDKRTTRAPFRGVVVAEHTESGQWLAKADPVVTLSDLLDEVDVVANVDQRELANIQLGAEVDVIVEGTSPREWKGCVTALISRSAWERGSRTFPVKVTITNQLATVDGRPQPILREGMLARLFFSGPEHEATLVPKNCLVRSETGTRLYAVIPGETPEAGKARPIMVEEGEAFGDKVEIFGDDPAPGMLVVTEGAERLTPFAEISIQSAAPAGTPGGDSAGAPPQAGQSPPASPAGPSSTASAPSGRSESNDAPQR